MSTDHLDLPRLVRGPEGLYFERKSLFEGPEGQKKARDRQAIRDDVAAVTAAFANADGGTLVLGVEDDGTVTGHHLPETAVDDILMVPERRLTPPLRRGERAAVEGHEILVFEVESAPIPVMVQGDGYPCRVGDAVVRMDAAAHTRRRLRARRRRPLTRSRAVRCPKRRSRTACYSARRPCARN